MGKKRKSCPSIVGGVGKANDNQDQDGHLNMNHHFSSATPITLLYGSESSIHTYRIDNDLSCLKKHTRRSTIHNVSFLGCRFHDITSTFRLLDNKLRPRQRKLQELTISRCVPRAGNSELICLASLLNCNSMLRVLDLTGASFDAKAIHEIRTFFKMNSSLEVLALGENEYIGDDGVDAITVTLQEGQGKLQVLNMEACGLGHFGSLSISNYMSSVSASSLRVLELSHNNLADAGVEKLVESIKINQFSLEYIGLNDVGLSDVGTLKLADMLSTNKSLHTLSLQNNGSITDIGASSLLKSIYNTSSISTVIESNHTLMDLNLKGCHQISSDILQFTSLLSKQSDELQTTNSIVRFKVSNYFKNVGCATALGALDSFDLMPNILAFVSRENGLDGLFRTIMSLPTLYSVSSTVEKDPMLREEDFNSFIIECKPASRRKRRYRDVFRELIPRRSYVCLCKGARKFEHVRSKCNTSKYLLESGIIFSVSL